MTIGSPLSGRVLIVDDVISAGTSVNESVQIIRSAGATPAGVVIAVDRQERGSGPLSAAQEVRQRHGIDVASVMNLETLLEFLKSNPGSADFKERVQAYRREYGV